MALIQSMLDAGGDPDFETTAGHPLTLCTQQIIEGRRGVDLLEMLLLKGASPDRMEQDHIVAPHGGSALMLACRAGRSDIVSLLLSQGADPNLWNYNDEGPIHEAAASGNIEVLRLLVQVGAEPHVPTLTGLTPLMCAASVGDIASVSFLLDRGIDKTARNDGTQTAADIARAAGHVAVVAMLDAPEEPSP